MKNDKGFTLVEIIGLILVMAVIALVVYPTISAMFKDGEQKRYVSYQNSVIQAAQLYVERNRSSYPALDSSGGKVTITCSELINKNYLKASVKNPRTNSSNCNILITADSSKRLSYAYEGK